ncbi:MAG: DUF5666 domain-containing protein [Oculatellaceae cyanobacterium Prado106]|nr:DUF5666 domain-containing protein [Oculatellaceae cyanobacterium Prado106]
MSSQGRAPYPEPSTPPEVSRSNSLRSHSTLVPPAPPELIQIASTHPVEVPGWLRRRPWWTGFRLHQGIVTFLHAWQGQPSVKFLAWQPGWVFNLQRTDRHWQALQDRHGLLIPVVEVEYKVEAVHGPPLEEGSLVVVEGNWHRQKLRATHIWNLSPSRMSSSSGHLNLFKGQVSNWDYPRSVPDTRYPGRSIEIWNFRLRRVDTQGNLLPPIPVEIRAESIAGTLRNGDEVEVQGQIVDGTLYAQSVRNLSLASHPAIAIRGHTGILMP